MKGAFSKPTGLMDPAESLPFTHDSGADGTGSYVWEVPGKPVSVEIEPDVVDRMLREVQRGFGLVPRRGVELGGILIGSVEPVPGRSGEWMVKVQDFEGVPCAHSKGMAYQLSDEEQSRFEETLQRWKRAPGRHAYAVGYYRSHTREGLGLAEEDVELFDRLFPEPGAITLLVKPFATRTSVGAIFFREDGQMRTESSYLEFPFRAESATQEAMNGEEAGARQSPPPRAGRAAQPGPIAIPSFGAGASRAADPGEPEGPSFGIPGTRRDPATGKRFRTGWVWLPLSFVFLLFGSGLGFFMGVNLKSNGYVGSSRDPLSLGLTLDGSADDIEVHWDRGSLAVQGAARGSLIIGDGANQKVVHLDSDQLQTGSVLYQRAKGAAGDVQFRLEVFARERTMIAETSTFKGKGASPAAGR